MEVETTVVLKASPTEFHPELFGTDILHTTAEGKRVRLVTISDTSDMVADVAFTTKLNQKLAAKIVRTIPATKKNARESERQLAAKLNQPFDHGMTTRDVWFVRTESDVLCFTKYHGDVWRKVNISDQLAGRTEQIQRIISEMQNFDAVNCVVTIRGDVNVVEGTYGDILLAETGVPGEVARAVFTDYLLVKLLALKNDRARSA